MSALLDLLLTVSRHWWAWVVPMTWQVVVLAAAVGVVTFVARKASPHLRYWLWFLVLVKLCLPPSLSFVTGVGTVAPSPKYVWVAPREFPHSGAKPAAAWPMTPPPAVAPLPPRVRIPAHTWLFHAWLAGMVAVTGLLVVQYRRMAARLGIGRPVTEPRILALLDECRALMGVRRTVPLVTADGLPSPVLFGALRPRIALPSSVTENLSLTGLKPILLHELAHLKRHDLWLNWAQFAVQAVYWFNPVVYVAGWRMRRERELIADDRVLHSLGGASESYSSSLLHVVKQSQQRWRMAPGLVGIGEDGAEVAGRVERILDSRRRLYVRLGAVSAVVVVIAALVLIPQARGKGWPFMKKSSADAGVDIPKLDGITIDGNAGDWGDRGFQGALTGVHRNKLMGREDLGVVFRVGWNESGLLFLLNVHGDHFEEASSVDALWGRSCVELFVADSLGGANLVQTIVSPGITAAQPEMRTRIYDGNRPTGLRERVPARVEAARTKVGGGYVLEALLPWDMLDVVPELGREVAFQFYVGDVDRENMLGRALWYPVHGAHADSRLMHRLRLAERTGGYRPTFAVATELADRTQLRWSFACEKRHAGNAVTVRRGRRVMARAVLKADGDIATATCLATREQYAEPAGPAEVVVDNPAGPPFVSIVSVDAIPALGLALPTPTPEGEVFLPSLQHPGKMRGSMLSHLLACAKYLGYSQSDAWLAGATGLAFALNVRPDLLPERPGPDANHLRAAAAHYDRIVALFGPALQDDGPESYRQIIGDLGKQKAHAEKVLKPVKAELAAAGQEMEKALAAKQ